MRGEEWIADELRALDEAGLRRNVAVCPEAGGHVAIDGRTYADFSSNDYLNLARDPRVVAAAQEALRSAGAGATASRLLTGTLPCHQELEHRLARLKRYPCALVFGSGYAANTGVLPALVGRGDTVLADKLAHASIIDGAVLSRAALHRFEHNDAAHLDAFLGRRQTRGRCLVVTESVFSMDGDLAPLAEIAEVCGRHGAMLMVDEAHATGVFGPGGSGRVRELGLENAVNVSMGTLSKALGGYGGFVACSEALRNWLVNRARSFIYSTALPPSAAGAALGALDVLDAEPAIGERLRTRADFLRERLQEAGFRTGKSASPIIPVMIGDNVRALAVARRLREQGVLAAAIRPPTVPAGTARLRLSVTLAHTERELEEAVAALSRAAQAEGVL